MSENALGRQQPATMTRPWRAWDTVPRTMGRRAPATEANLAAAVRAHGSPPLTLARSPDRPADLSPPAKYPPYFAQASPRGRLPRLNLKASTQTEGAASKDKSWAVRSNPTETKASIVSRKDMKARSLDSSSHTLYDTALLSHRASWNKGWITERSFRLAKEQRRYGERKVFDLPPTASNMEMPGGSSMQKLMHKRTPPEFRSAAERCGHAGLVSKISRQALSNNIIVSLLDIAGSSTDAFVQAQAPPALAGLCGVGANRAMLGAFGAMETLLGLARAAKNTQTKLEAWQTMNDLILSSKNFDRFLQLGGLAEVVSASEHKDARIKAGAAKILQSILSSNMLPLEQRCECESIRALCTFVTCGDVKASTAAGSTLWTIARQSVEKNVPWPVDSILDVAGTLCRDMELMDETSHLSRSRAAKASKGFYFVIKTLSLLLDKHKRSRIAVYARSNACLERLWRGLLQTGALMGNMPSDLDLYYVRAIACLTVATPSMQLLADTELTNRVAESITFLLCILHDAMPSHWSERRRRIARIGEDEKGIVPEALDKQSCITVIANRICFCMPTIRSLFVAKGFLPTLLELCASKHRAKIRQGAANAVFNLVQDETVQTEFASLIRANGSQIDAFTVLVSTLSASKDPVVTMTILRVCHRLGQIESHLKSLYSAGIISELCDVIAEALKTDNSRPIRITSLLLRNAFQSTDLMIKCMEFSEDFADDFRSRNLGAWLFQCCNDIVLRYRDAAWDAMGHGRTKILLLNHLAEQAGKLDGEVHASQKPQISCAVDRSAPSNSANDKREDGHENANRDHTIHTLAEEGSEMSCIQSGGNGNRTLVRTVTSGRFCENTLRAYLDENNSQFQQRVPSVLGRTTEYISQTLDRFFLVRELPVQSRKKNINLQRDKLRTKFKVTSCTYMRKMHRCGST